MDKPTEKDMAVDPDFEVDFLSICHSTDTEASLANSAMTAWRRAVAAEAEVERLSEIVRLGIEESIGKAQTQFIEDGLQIEHWAARLMVASFANTIADAPNCVELEAHDVEGDRWFLITIQRKSGKSPLTLRSEAVARAESAEAENASLRERIAILERKDPDDKYMRRIT